MPWRVHLSNRALHRLDILNTPKSSLIAAWSQPERVAYFDLESGAAIGEQSLEIADSDVRQYGAWQSLMPQLVAPNGAYLPVVANDSWTVHSTRDGQRRFYYGDAAYLVTGAQEIKLDIESIVAVSLERASGLLALLDAAGKLHVYEPGNVSTHQFDIGLANQPDARSRLALMGGGHAIVVASEHVLLKVDRQGRLLKNVELPYSIGRFASSPNGQLLACGDRDANVIRIYDGERFQPMFQRHAIDMMASATQLQLIADLPPSRVAMNSLAIDNVGNLAFALAGVMCVTAVAQMRTLPRPQKLI